MFGRKNKDNQFASGGTTLFARSVEVMGDVKFGGNLEVEGVVKGNIYADPSSDARVRIMEKGDVTGEIHAPKVVINGRVDGDVYSTKHLELAANARVNGNVHYDVIEMVKGAEVNGKLVHISDADEAKLSNSSNNKVSGATKKGKTDSLAAAVAVPSTAADIVK